MLRIENFATCQRLTPCPTGRLRSGRAWAGDAGGQTQQGDEEHLAERGVDLGIEIKVPAVLQQAQQRTRR